MTYEEALADIQKRYDEDIQSYERECAAEISAVIERVTAQLPPLLIRQSWVASLTEPDSPYQAKLQARIAARLEQAFREVDALNDTCTSGGR